MTTRTPEFRSNLLSQRTAWAAGAYDALSAKLIESAGFDAIFTSGFCISGSLLGLPDVELYTMSENLSVVRNICNAVNRPVIADTDTGYGNAINVMRTVREFESAGVAGMVFEDQASPKRCPACANQLELLPVEEAAGKIRAAAAARRDPNLIIVARTDAPTPEEAIRRGKAYVAAGADLIQTISPTFTDIEGLRAMRSGCGVPLSLQINGWLETDLSPTEVESIAGLAVFPLVPLMTAAAALRENLAVLRHDRSAKSLPRPKLGHKEFGEFLGFGAIEELQRRYLAPSGAEAVEAAERSR